MRRHVILGGALLSGCLWFAAAPISALAATDVQEVDYHELKDSDGEIFMEVKATRGEIDAVRKQLLHHPGLNAIAFLDHRDALSEARRIFKGDKELSKGLTADMLPTSFRVRFASHVNRDDFAQQFERQQGVDEVKLRPTKAEEREARKAAALNRTCRGDVDIEVFMTVSAPTAQEDAVAAALATTPGIESVDRVSHERAASTFACLFPGEPVPPAATLPASFRLRVRTMSVVILLAQGVKTMPGVDVVQY